MLKHLNRHYILYEHQYGFHKNFTTDMALMQLVDKIFTTLNNNEHALGIFLHLSKAFDTVDHKILLSKLYYYGIHDYTYNWLYSYVYDREQFVYLIDCAFTKDKISCGVQPGLII